VAGDAFALYFVDNLKQRWPSLFFFLRFLIAVRIEVRCVFFIYYNLSLRRPLNDTINPFESGISNRVYQTIRGCFMKSNYAFLNDHFPELAMMEASLAEDYLYSDENSCLIKLGLFAETMR